MRRNKGRTEGSRKWRINKAALLMIIEQHELKGKQAGINFPKHYKNVFKIIPLFPAISPVMADINVFLFFIFMKDSINNYHPRHPDRLTWVRLPGVKGHRHGRNSEWWSTAVGLHQYALDGGGRQSALSQGRFQRRDAVELHPGEAADEARSVITLDEHAVYLTRFWKSKQHKQNKIRGEDMVT